MCYKVLRQETETETLLSLSRCPSRAVSLALCHSRSHSRCPSRCVTRAVSLALCHSRCLSRTVSLVLSLALSLSRCVPRVVPRAVPLPLCHSRCPSPVNHRECRAEPRIYEPSRTNTRLGLAEVGSARLGVVWRLIKLGLGSVLHQAWYLCSALGSFAILDVFNFNDNTAWKEFMVTWWYPLLILSVIWGTRWIPSRKCGRPAKANALNKCSRTSTSANMESDW